MNAVSFSRKYRGVSLIELLISMVIGLVVVAAVIVNFVDSGKAGSYQAALSQMNQDAQIGLNLLSREVQMAGYRAPGNALGAEPVFGCDGTHGTVPFLDPAAATTPTCGAAVEPTSSALEVVYEADVKNTVPKSGVPPLPSDCLGNGLTISGTFYIARNRYFVDTGTGANTSGRPELYCASAVSAKYPLLENVEDLQVWYGVVDSDSPSQVIRYAKAGKDTTTADTVNAQATTEWANVMSVRICLLMRSAEPILTGEDTLTYLDCDSATQTSSDHYLRRAYFTTATIRSKMAP